MTMGGSLLGSVLVPIVAVAATVAIVKTVWPLGGKGKGKPVSHWHYKSKRPVSHRHSGGGTSHKHSGLPGYGRNKSTLHR